MSRAGGRQASRDLGEMRGCLAFPYHNRQKPSVQEQLHSRSSVLLRATPNGLSLFSA